MSIENGFGKIDLYRLLSDEAGSISFSLYDSGTQRTGQCRYGYALEKDDLVSIWPASNPQDRLLLMRYIPLKPHTIVFVGLYIGDGAKAASRSGSAGIVSFSQREPHIANFVRSHFVQLFGNSVTFTHRVNEDALFFMTDEMRGNLAKLRDEMQNEGRTDVLSGERLEAYLKRDLESVIEEQPSATKIALKKHSKKAALIKHRKYLVEFFANRVVMNEYLRRKKLGELEESGCPLSSKDRIAVNIRLPGVKGSREEGKSSRSDELDVIGLSHFHTLFLRLLSDIQSSIQANKKEVKIEGSDSPWLIWDGEPHEYCRFSLATGDYLEKGERCGRYSSKGLVRHKCQVENDMADCAIGKFSFEAPKAICLTPLLCLFFGLYLAEGQTPKWKIFELGRSTVGSLNVGFTASEPDSVKICLEAMKKLILGDKGNPNYWRLKIGAKYFPETITIGNKIGTVALRRGPKGQGAASGLEIIETLRKWAVQSLPALAAVESKFDHVEYTGAGIPRIDLFYPKGPETFLFSIMRDVISNPVNLDRFCLSGDKHE